MIDYRNFLSSFSRKQWERIGLQRRSGVVAPLFSLYSQYSAGIGELTDLIFLIDWCKACGMSIIQLLPMNDVGFDFRPYDAQSTFALEPMYLSLRGLKAVKMSAFKAKLDKLSEKFPAGGERVDYGIKQAKLELLWGVFGNHRDLTDSGGVKDFNRYLEENKFWLEDYALFKVIKEKNNQSAWEAWEDKLKYRDQKALELFEQDNSERISFHKWLQWQLYEQFRVIKKYAQGRQVFIMGDLPFLVSRDSADVWAKQDYFKLNLSSGAPPDMYFAHGQRWGMPVYNWPVIEKNDYDYLKEKLKYAQNFYDFFRIDHVVGIFRVWTIPLDEPQETGGLNGTFDPADESVWEEHGRKILTVMVENTTMLPCAEDLGVIPPCSNKVLYELGIPGIEVQRWSKDWGRTYNFKAPGDYRINSVATVSTHDSSSLCAWWQFEAGTIDEQLFKRKCKKWGVNFEELKNELFDLKQSTHNRLRWKESVQNPDVLLEKLKLPRDKAGEFINLYLESHGEKGKFLNYLKPQAKQKACLSEPARIAMEKACLSDLIRMAMEKASNTASIFSIQLLQDWISIDCLNECDLWEFRINFPGTVSPKNWSLVMPLSLEDMLALPMNTIIKNINSKAERI
ncbi:MAG: 4-alpha-glucanotransferase [Omnitrophica WOR_2 bacterium RIFOXYB2_FULL_45_11]|nr:MAG: 4-alpha-glucanotransferase [Omnitrophica WOR_2 bacterium RIFOXYA2_FULL_45_12]OGX54393.1 MAG: 4-alpha-glucanotransferase [Omnitrophica WOR_2 bacterium RIFOXYB2_FULL_45_11]OGX60596.1 MAG: 4-alpha-glucanotransferase [Omnitrophica WOR_2 bacterium RIFOXYC2_FULL_45_15]HBU07921.1 4-alpha-glucanotransferase [Candidatus Omnitrophota bacterium]